MGHLLKLCQGHLERCFFVATFVRWRTYTSAMVIDVVRVDAGLAVTHIL